MSPTKRFMRADGLVRLHGARVSAMLFANRLARSFAPDHPSERADASVAYFGSTCYIVSFELSSPFAQGPFIERLKSYGQYCPITNNCWAILTTQNATQIVEFLRAAMMPQDRLFVIRSGTHAAWSNTFGDANSEWLKKNL